MRSERARELLARERTELEGTLARLRADVGRREREAAGELADVDQHQAEAGTETNDRAMALGRIEELEARLAAVERAEGRLERGEYGRSVASGAPIPDERLEALPAAELTAEEEAAAERTPATGSDPGDDRTPLDEPAPPQPDLGRIPMAGGDPEPVVDPQEEGDAVVPGPGEAYPGEGGAPRVGEPEPDDAAAERSYRPD